MSTWYSSKYHIIDSDTDNIIGTMNGFSHAHMAGAAKGMYLLLKQIQAGKKVKDAEIQSVINQAEGKVC